ncbi:hypothetical protein HOLleu_27957 [Holothuria leucospilota]|uniref:Uncharacterized protein n=1 Tax=Holothuria leucospilota TaxID=206669 RepID=A0A9Q1H3U2_HOLLE|nr:hypothetical protein HOLleu_27957 [Holothuria leucospilota]
MKCFERLIMKRLLSITEQCVDPMQFAYRAGGGGGGRCGADISAQSLFSSRQRQTVCDIYFYRLLQCIQHDCSTLTHCQINCLRCIPSYYPMDS